MNINTNYSNYPTHKPAFGMALTFTPTAAENMTKYIESMNPKKAQQILHKLEQIKLRQKDNPFHINVIENRSGRFFARVENRDFDSFFKTYLGDIKAAEKFANKLSEKVPINQTELITKLKNLLN